MKKIMAISLALTLLLAACTPAAKPSDGQTTESTTTTTSSGTGETTTTTTTGSAVETGGSTTATSSTTTSGGTTSGGTTATSSTTKPTTSTTKPTTAPTVTLNAPLEAADMELLQKIVDTENAWLANMQLSNGAFPMTPTNNGSVKVTPYFSDFAALSLLNQANLYKDNVKAYMEWHFNHLNTAAQDYNRVDGTIYDYTISVSAGKVTGETSLRSYDSTDSYAAMFLIVLQKYVETTGDKAYVIGRAADVERIVNALFATMVGDLTLAKPDYAIKYLMDNCEVYEGLMAGAKLYKDTLVPAGASAATRDKLAEYAGKVANAIETRMWNSKGGYYHPALGADNAVAWTFNWNEYYPSSTSQTFLIIHGLLDPTSERAKTLYNTFCQYVDWENFNHPDTFYWGSNVYTAALMGDYASAKTYFQLYEKVMKRHNYPLYNADAARVALAADLFLRMA